MRPEDLHLFTRQLALWAESAITRGRTPFRRVETFPPLMSAEGEVAPPLVLWINRDSFMAGGVLLLPPDGSEAAVASGRDCARALGLRHFATWDPARIVIWEDAPDEIRAHRTLALAQPRSPDAFRTALEQLLEEFKLLCVLGSVSPQELSAHYFANLARATLDAAFASLVESARIAQGEGRLAPSACPVEHARAKGALVLLRLLALLLHERLPPGVQPENLEKAMGFALEELPAPLSSLLLPPQQEISLCPEASVRFHLLLRRLGQLRFGEDRPRAAQVLDIFLGCEGPRLGGHPPPAPADDDAPVLLLNAAPPADGASVAAEVAPLPLLALGALLRTLRGEPLPQIARETPFSLAPTEIPSTILGTLSDRSLASAAQRQILHAHLRASWPNRRFPLPPHTPLWAWEFLHLLGLCPEEGEIALNLPGGWLCGDFAAILLAPLRESYTLTALHHTGGTVRLRLRRTPLSAAKTRLGDASGETLVPWESLMEAPLPLFALALAFPSLFAPLLQREPPAFQRADSAPWGRQQRSIVLFARTSLGRALWKICGAGEPPPSESDLEAKAIRCGWPVPACETLDRLAAADTGTSARDAALAAALGLPHDFAAALAAPGSPASERAASPRSLARTIAATVFADGIPRFPEQYLYDHYRPQLQRFTFSSALQIEHDFFGEITLRDAEGHRITVQGQECARALELASSGGRTDVALPVDPHLTGAILERYLHDLRHLKQTLLRQTHLRAADARAADALAQRIWKSLPLPPWALIDR